MDLYSHFLLAALRLFWGLFSYPAAQVVSSDQTCSALSSEAFLGFELMENLGLDIKDMQNNCRTSKQLGLPSFILQLCHAGNY